MKKHLQEVRIYFFRVDWSGNKPHGNKKLAGNVKNGKRQYVIETRSQGGYAIVAPSVGYECIQGDLCDLPIISIDDFDSIMSFCKSLDRIGTNDIVFSPKQEKSDKWDITPAEDFDSKGDVIQIIESIGWTRVTRGNNGYIRFTKPQGKKGDVHGSYDVVNRRFRCFSTNAHPFEDKTYTATGVYVQVKKGGDWKGVLEIP